MLDAGEHNSRSRYQNVVEATSNVRAWTLEWFLTFGIAKSDTPLADEASKQNKETYELLVAARDMVTTGLLQNFFTTEDEIPAEIGGPRGRLIEALESVIRSMESTSRNIDSVNDLELRKLALTSAHDVGNALNDFLRELNNYVAMSESEETGRNAGLISGALSEIGKINETINLIAVNASVEAARAGEAGRGFSVIASEIQSLSHKSADVFRDLKKRLR